LGLVLLARDLSFFYDEWGLILGRPLTFEGLLAPWNGHLIAPVVVVYWVLGAIVGTSSYWPYLAVVWAAHASVVCLVYVMASHHVSEAWALAVSLLMAVLGAGSENILWAFQMGVVGALALGIAGVWISPRRPVVAAVLLTLSVVTNGVGLACIVGAGVHLAIARPRSLGWVLIPIVVWATWYLVYGAGSLARDPSFDGTLAFVVSGILYGAAGVLGSREVLAGVAGLLIIVVALWRGRIQLSPDLWALLAVAIGFLGLSALVRAQGGVEAAGASRYIYVLAPSLLVVGAAILYRSDAARHLAPLLLAAALIGNVTLLVTGHTTRLERQRCEEAYIPIAERMITSELRSHAC
jgi:hypothetical protein